MKRFVICWLAAMCIHLGSSAQNLIPNPSFENLGTPPCNWIISTGGFTSAVDNWTMPSNGSTDIFSTYVNTSCYGHVLSTHGSSPGQQMPRTGNAMSALLTYGDGCGWQPNYREYLQAQLTSPMVSGQAYDVEFYISLGDAASNATNNFGAHFRTNSFFQSTCFVISPTPQFNHTGVVNNSSGWTLISGTVTATANWNYVIIGNFFSNAATATQFAGGSAGNTRYFIDDVSVQPAVTLPAAELAFEGHREQGGEVMLSWDYWGSADVDAYRLQRSMDGMNWQDIAHPEGTARAFEDRFPPQGELLYRLRYKGPDGSQYTSETVAIAPGAFPYEVVISPNPANSGATISLNVAHGDDAQAVLEVFDIQGRRLMVEEGFSVAELNGFDLSTVVAGPGIYFARMSAGGGHWSKRFLVQ